MSRTDAWYKTEEIAPSMQKKMKKKQAKKAKKAKETEPSGKQNMSAC